MDHIKISKKKIEFPVSYTLKIIVQAVKSIDENKELIKNILNSLQIPFSEITTRKSKTGKYISYSVEVTIIDQQQFDHLYQKLKKIPHLKVAI